MLGITVVGVNGAVDGLRHIFSGVGGVALVGCGVLVGSEVSVEEVGHILALVSHCCDWLGLRLTRKVVVGHKLVVRLASLTLVALVTSTLLEIIIAWLRSSVLKEQLLLLCVHFLCFTLHLSQREFVCTTMYSHNLLATIGQTS